MNLVVLTGRLTREVELKSAQSGKSYMRFSIAVDRAFQRDEADFINCVAFGKTAELIADYVKKGQKIGVQGRLQMNRYEKDGEKRTTYDVVVDSIEFLNSKGSNNESRQQGNQSHQEVADDEEFPF